MTRQCVICGKFTRNEFFCKRCKKDRAKKVSLLKYLARIYEKYGEDNASLRLKYHRKG